MRKKQALSQPFATVDMDHTREMQFALWIEEALDCGNLRRATELQCALEYEQEYEQEQAWWEKNITTKQQRPPQKCLSGTRSGGNRTSSP